MRTVIIILLFLAHLLVGGLEASATSSSRELRVRLEFKLPIDPSRIVTMADYDLSLLLSKTWFGYDKSRKAVPGLISSWKFDEKKGGYLLEIDAREKWSDGSPLTSNDLMFGLKKGLHRSKDGIGASVSELIDLDSSFIIDDRSFFVAIKKKKGSESFFQRMSAIFWAVTSPKDHLKDLSFTQTGNTVSIGPYVIREKKDDEIVLEKNRFYVGDISKAPDRVVVKRGVGKIDLEKFLERGTWENYIQINTLISPELVEKLKVSKFPFWTRGVDRISLLKPHGTGRDLEGRKKLGVAIATEFHKKEGSYNLGVSKASSLQPFGYPLFDPMKYGVKIHVPENFLKREIKIVSYESSFHDFHERELNPIFRSLGLRVNWAVKTRAEYLRLTSDTDKSSFDFELSGFGVADPEPATWLGLVLGEKFISVSQAEMEKFREILAINDFGKEITAFKFLLKDIQSKGGFSPLFFFSTLSVGHPQMSFKRVEELDETVDYSKISFE